MVEKSIVLETIKRMLSSGLNDSVIASTLKDIGLSDSETRQLIAEAKGVSQAAQQEPVTSNEEQASESELHERIAEATAQKVKQHFEQKSAEDALVHTTTHAAIEGYGSQLNELAARLSGIERKLGSINTVQLADFSSKTVALGKKISVIEADLSEVKAISNALKSLLEKLLDTNRSILTELEEKQ